MNIPVQFSPVYPGLQVHVKALIPSVHIAFSKHGMDAHSLISEEYNSNLTVHNCFTEKKTENVKMISAYLYLYYLRLHDSGPI